MVNYGKSSFWYQTSDGEEDGKGTRPENSGSFPHTEQHDNPESIGKDCGKDRGKARGSKKGHRAGEKDRHETCGAIGQRIRDPVPVPALRVRLFPAPG